MYKTFENDQPNLSSVFHSFSILGRNILATYYFDPRYRGQFLPQNHTTMSYILEETSKLVNAESRGQLTQELLQYHNKSGPFECEHLWSDEAVGDPNIWWAVLRTERPVIGAIASKLMSIPASSAAAERNWSHFVHQQDTQNEIDEEDFIMISSDEEDEIDDDE
ncbi:unnamed protein product [Rhizophagus irregularis]|nr:unnamed protein product [Rhizophagus irregularis]